MMLLQSESLARGWARWRRNSDRDWPATVTGRPQAYMILIRRVSRPGHAEMWLPSRPLSGWAVKLTRSLGPATDTLRFTVSSEKRRAGDGTRNPA